MLGPLKTILKPYENNLGATFGHLSREEAIWQDMHGILGLREAMVGLNLATWELILAPACRTSFSLQSYTKSVGLLGLILAILGLCINLGDQIYTKSVGHLGAT